MPSIMLHLQIDEAGGCTNHRQSTRRLKKWSVVASLATEHKPPHLFNRCFWRFTKFTGPIIIGASMVY